MCGIVGYVGEREAATVLLPALKRLEYRGYDSAGLATVNGNGIDLKRCVGKLGNLEQVLTATPLPGHVGIGHTRWATHGRPSEENAHPHRVGRVAVVHNGIVENFLELRAELEGEGRHLTSETDTEVIAHLIDRAMESGLGLLEATRDAVGRLEGSFAIVALSPEEKDHLVAAKTATPIVIGVAEGEVFVASDVPAILEYTRDVIFLEDGEIADVRPNALTITDFEGRARERSPRRITWDALTAQKGGYKHFLSKEIHEQPEALVDTLRGRIRLAAGDVALEELEDVQERLASVDRAVLLACGTARHAAMVAKAYLMHLSGLQVEVDYASEFRYSRSVLGPNDLVVAVSQSGETADTLGCVEMAIEQGAPTIALCNVVDSSIARRADAAVYTHAGPEVSVCSTKAFTTQVAALFLLAVHLGRRRKRLDAVGARSLLAHLRNVPPLVREALAQEDDIREVARRHAHAKDFLYMGRGVNYPIALEGALKLKEISYIHAEGYAAGEMKHGPIALVTDETPVVFVMPRDELFSKTLGNLKEIESRGGRILAVTDHPTEDLERISSDVIVVPSIDPFLSPFLTTIPLQLLAYHIAVERGTDVDQPRNLAKSVTVE